jgi:hypothetical protein
MLAVIPLEVLVRLHIVLPELLDDILTYVRIVFFHLPGDLKLVLGRYLRHLATLSHQVKYELRDISPGNRDVFDGAADHIALGAGDHMGHAITGVDDRARERAVCDTVRAP